MDLHVRNVRFPVPRPRLAARSAWARVSPSAMPSRAPSSSRPTRALGFSTYEALLRRTRRCAEADGNTQTRAADVSVAALTCSASGLRAGLRRRPHLGEYLSLVAAGALHFPDAVRWSQRGQYMQSAVPPGVGAMAALLKLPDGKLEDVLWPRPRAR